ncbi:ATP-dependent helicase HepA [Enhygromyxa salina]|uniref:ATP-dependent helicase HepA n=1 Tax=Enhygromyxa salina TaxID=215803 RepID=A0A2S9Y2Q6_9BACT|nr:helicase-related protein [Enhygromyxa salina]PRP99384.1 ATP-dependent helicase HepA [Enhygromyxa salina]
MTMTLDELRAIMRLDVRARADKIPQADIERQELTVLRARALLADQPGVVLADEVGMGKTFEALGVAALVHHDKPRAKIAIITPGPDLNTKWSKELPHFAAVHDFGSHTAVRRLGEFVREAPNHSVTIAPMTMFQSGHGAAGRAWLLSMYFHWKDLHGRTGNAILKRYDSSLHRVDVYERLFLGRFTADAFSESSLRRAFCRTKAHGGAAGLDDLFEDGGLDAFRSQRAVRDALHRARTQLARSQLPIFDLLIVDEAHKLKNANALRTRGLQTTMSGRHRKAIFLTATPFQLEVGELRQVFHLFATAKGAPKDLDDQVHELLEGIRDYQRCYTEFQTSWGQLETGQAAEFRTIYAVDPSLGGELDDPSLRIVAASLRELIRLKEQTLEPGLRRWMIRSLRSGKREYRDHDERTLDPVHAGSMPFLVYERFIAELFRNPAEGGTHKAAAEINMVSSFAAARSGALLSDSGRSMGVEAESYRELLRSILDEAGEGDGRHHAKVTFSLEDALGAGMRDEKTLVFCTRVATLRRLKARLEEAWYANLLQRWRDVYPEIEREAVFGDVERDAAGRERRRIPGRHQAVQKRLHAHSDALYLALRERYLHTVLPIAAWARAHVDEFLAAANTRLDSLKVRKTAAERRDFKLAKRCVEQAAAAHWHALGSPTSALSAAPHQEGVAALLDERFLALGLDLVKDPLEQDEAGDHEPRWTIDRELALDVIGDGRSLWPRAATLLNELDLVQRVRVTELLARYLGFQQVPFVAELLGAAKAAGLGVDSIESRPLRRFIDQFWDQPTGRPWLERLIDFLRFFIDRDDSHRESIIDEVLQSSKAAFARHTKDGSSRERLREAFNTPLYPMVLIANEVMQEGLDLHRSCRRVVHHDLAWNPAQLEQRVGRVDRLGSKLLRLRENDETEKLKVVYPMIRGTIDERLFEVVRRREKWLEFLLGAPPNLREYRLGDEEPPPLPEGLAERLAVDLGPGSRS